MFIKVEDEKKAKEILEILKNYNIKVFKSEKESIINNILEEVIKDFLDSEVSDCFKKFISKFKTDDCANKLFERLDYGDDTDIDSMEIEEKIIYELVNMYHLETLTIESIKEMAFKNEEGKELNISDFSEEQQNTIRKEVCNFLGQYRTTDLDIFKRTTGIITNCDDTFNVRLVWSLF